MAIEFPPPPTPLLADTAVLQADASRAAVSVRVRGFTMLVHAPGVLDEAEILAAVAGLDDLSNAVRALATAAQRNGVLAPKTLYARSDETIYVSVYPATINRVTAPAQLSPYFDGLAKGDAPPSITAFERRRLLASVHANRMGFDYSPVFSVADGGGYDLTLKRGADAINAGAVRVNLSNAGNRFTGREFLDLDARSGTSAGDEFSVLARSAVKALGIDDEEPGSDYHEVQLGWSRVTPIGLFGIAGRYLDYRQQAAGVGFNGELWTVDAGYTGILRSTTTNRVTVQAKADYTYKQLEQAADGLLRQKEPYASAELGAAWSSSFRLSGLGFLSQTALIARQGFGDGDPRLTRADLGYTLLRPSFSLRAQGAVLAGELQMSLQYADVTVPEQQQWIVGGNGSLYAYVPGVAVGDRGALVRLVGEYASVSAYTITFKPRVFVEFAAAEYAEEFADRPTDGVQTVTDAGAEVVLGFRPWLETALVAAIPLQDSGISQRTLDEARSNFFFRLTAKF